MFTKNWVLMFGDPALGGVVHNNYIFLHVYINCMITSLSTWWRMTGDALLAEDVLIHMCLLQLESKKPIISKAKAQPPCRVVSFSESHHLIMPHS